MTVPVLDSASHTTFIFRIWFCGSQYELLSSSLKIFTGTVHLREQLFLGHIHQKFLQTLDMHFTQTIFNFDYSIMLDLILQSFSRNQILAMIPLFSSNIIFCRETLYLTLVWLTVPINMSQVVQWFKCVTPSH